LTCPGCGAANPEEARTCLVCGSSLGVDGAGERKTVTVLFTDVVGSTALGERLDPEALRALMARVFALARGVIERHGGVVEKFIGDAVMAVFGLPARHEDDALRAVRAAAELHRALGEANRELGAQFGVELRLRTGVQTGLVVVGDPGAGQALATGDAVNTAARLQQAAAPGEVLLGQETFGLVREQVRAEPVGPLELKGKEAAIRAFRLLGLLRALPERRLAAPMVGREGELAALGEAFEAAAGEGRCVLATVVGPAGIGKSRLVREFARTLGPRARVLFGRCLSYGEGITFWALGEVVRQAAGIGEEDRPAEAVAKIARLLAAPGAEKEARRVGALFGLVEAPGSEAEGFAACRKLLEALGRGRPTVVVVEDLHWAEPALLDLLEYLALGARAPFLLVGTARPELAEHHPGWSSAVPGALTLHLQPLDEGCSQALLANLLGGGELDRAAQRRIAEAAEGNPLFLEELCAMLLEGGLLVRADGRWALRRDLAALHMPPTIQAVLEARIDRLEPAERAVLQCASVLGRVFSFPAVEELAGTLGVGRSGAQLLALARKGFILPEATGPPQAGELAEEDAYRFRHVLIRDAAYEGIPKARRAALHERAARWLEARAGERLPEVEELVGHHLERAFSLRAELESPEPWRGLATEAAGHLAAAGRRAMLRSDPRAAEALLGRARALLPPGEAAHRQLGLDLAKALEQMGALERAEEVLGEVEAAAVAAGDRLHAAHARLDLASIRVSVDPEGAAQAARAEAEAAMPVFEAGVDHLGMAKAWRLLAEPDHMLARYEPFRRAYERALEHLRKAPDPVALSDVLGYIAHALTYGPTPIPQALRRMLEILEEAPEDRRLRAHVRVRMAELLAYQGREAEALEAEAEGEAILEDLGVEFFFGSFDMNAGYLEWLLGRLDRAEERLRRSNAILERSGDRSYRSTALAILAKVLVDQGRVDEAEDTAKLALELGSSDDLATVVQALEALALASRGEPEAEETARRAVAVAERTDGLTEQGHAWEALASVLLAQGRQREAEQALQEALDRYERKGATLLASRVRARLG
jgi:class 3 adenylate cyclase/tetratricopeptide (TPR) repeat protein